MDLPWALSETVFGLATGVRPTDEDVRKFTRQVLKDGKGCGRAADLIRCSITELPHTIVDFLDQIYAWFPRPDVSEISVVTEKESNEPLQGATAVYVAESLSAESA